MLRDDQWLAIEALVAERRKTLVVQRTGWGKSAVYFLSTILFRTAGRRSDRDHLAAALADAEPDRRGGASGGTGRRDQLGERGGVGAALRRGSGRVD